MPVLRAFLALLAGLAAFLLILLALAFGLRQSLGTAAALVVLAFLCLPGAGRAVSRATGLPFPPLARAGAILVLVGLAGWTLLEAPRSSIYASQAVEAEVAGLYAEKLAAWPVPHESVMLETRRGRVHVVVSGPADAPPVLLLHPAALPSWVWAPNVAALNGAWRTYAVDLVGDAGLSRYDDLSLRMRNPEDQADHYAEVMDRLGIERAVVVGASEGGFIALNLARFHPERVERLALLAPMGFAGMARAALRITLAQLFPLGPVEDATFRWAFGSTPAVVAELRPWFHLVMSGAIPAKVPPWPLGAAERQAVRQPVLVVFGARDNVVGDPEAARALADDMPDARVEVIDAGHLVATERPGEVNALILGFLSEPAP
jgi:pimeloyl-ACP methyl ester carboxylesterase